MGWIEQRVTDEQPGKTFGKVYDSDLCAIRRNLFFPKPQCWPYKTGTSMDRGCVARRLKNTDDFFLLTPQGATRRRVLKRHPGNESWENGFNIDETKKEGDEGEHILSETNKTSGTKEKTTKTMLDKTTRVETS